MRASIVARARGHSSKLSGQDSASSMRSFAARACAILHHGRREQPMPCGAYPMSVLDRFLLSGTVDAVKDLTRGARRIRIVGQSLRDLAWTPGQHIRLLVGDLRAPANWIRGLRDTLRTYSIWDCDAADGWLDLCILDHPEPGPGARWSHDVRVGQRVSFTRPEGRLVLQDGAAFHLFVGEETASVAFGRCTLSTCPRGRAWRTSPGRRAPARPCGDTSPTTAAGREAPPS